MAKNLKIVYLILSLIFFINVITCITFNLESGKYEKNCGNLKTSSGDNILYYDWIQTWTEPRFSHCYAMTLDNLNNIYLGGSTHTVSGKDDTCIIKYNSAGIQQFNVTWSGSSNDDECYAIAVDSSFNIYISGYKYEDGSYTIYLAKFNAAGNYEWNRTWSGVSQWGSFADGIALDSSNNIFIVGRYSKPDWDWDIVLIKYNSMGEEQWNKTWGGSDNDFGRDLTLDSSDNIYVVGKTWSFGSGRNDMCLIKYDNNGVQLWNRTWGGSDNDNGEAITLDSLNNIYIGGTTESYGSGDYDFVLVKFDSFGAFQWYQTFGDSGEDFASTISCDSLDNVYIGGIRGCNIGIVKFTKSGAIELNVTWGSEIGQEECYYEDKCSRIYFDSSNNLYIAGFVQASHIYLMKSDSEFGISKAKEMLFTDDIEFSKTFSTSLERVPLQDYFKDQTHKAFITLRIIGYQDYFIIAFFDKSIASNTKFITEDKKNQFETILSIQLDEILNFSYDNNLLYRFYFNYTYTYEHCTNWDQVLCYESDYTSKSGTFLSDNYVITKKGISLYTPNSSIPINPIWLLSALIIGVLLKLKLIQRHKEQQ